MYEERMTDEITVYDEISMSDAYQRLGDFYFAKGEKNETFEDYSDLTKALENYIKSNTQTKIDLVTAKLTENKLIMRNSKTRIAIKRRNHVDD